MPPITNILSCTEVLDEFDSLSCHQTYHAKTYVTGLAAASSKTVEGIAREVLPAQSERALNKFFTEYDWEPQQVNHERLDELQNHGETRWSQDGYIIIDDSVNQKPGRNSPVLAGSTITPKARLSGDRTSSTRSTPTTKQPIRSPSANTSTTTTRTKPKPKPSTN